MPRLGWQWLFAKALALIALGGAVLGGVLAYLLFPVTSSARTGSDPGSSLHSHPYQDGPNGGFGWETGQRHDREPCSVYGSMPMYVHI